MSIMAGTINSKVEWISMASVCGVLSVIDVMKSKTAFNICSPDFILCQVFVPDHVNVHINQKKYILLSMVD